MNADQQHIWPVVPDVNALSKRDSSQPELFLARYWSKTLRLHDYLVFTKPGEVTDLDVVGDLAIDLIVQAGYNYESTDLLGQPVNEDLQTLLELALLRAPNLARLLIDLLDKPTT